MSDSGEPLLLGVLLVPVVLIVAVLGLVAWRAIVTVVDMLAARAREHR